MCIANSGVCYFEKTLVVRPMTRVLIKEVFKGFIQIFQLNTYMTQGPTCEVSMQVFIVFEIEDVLSQHIILQIRSTLSLETTEEALSQQLVPQYS